MGNWDDYQGYDPKGESIEDIVKRLSAQQKMIASTISDVEGNSSKITQQADEISLKVSETDFNGDTIIGKINLTSTTATISAENIDLNGYVTVTSLSTEGSTTIHGGNITTGMIDAKYISTEIGQVSNTLLVGSLTSTGTLLLGSSSNVESKIYGWSDLGEASIVYEATNHRFFGDLDLSLVSRIEWGSHAPTATLG